MHPRPTPKSFFYWGQYSAKFFTTHTSQHIYLTIMYTFFLCNFNSCSNKNPQKHSLPRVGDCTLLPTALHTSSKREMFCNLLLLVLTPLRLFLWNCFLPPLYLSGIHIIRNCVRFNLRLSLHATHIYCHWRRTHKWSTPSFLTYSIAVCSTLFRTLTSYEHIIYVSSSQRSNPNLFAH